MNYYLIAPASRSYLGPQPLTFEYVYKLQIGQIVWLNVRGKKSLGIVIKPEPKPSFKTTSVDAVVPELIIPNANIKLFQWISGYYPGSIGPTASLFTPPAITKKPTKAIEDVRSKEFNSKITLPSLTKSQNYITDQILSSTKLTHLIHGDTGTGKTRIYLELAKKCLGKNQSALILTPEISLTPQLANNFASLESPEHKVIIVHSGLTDAQRRTIWLDCRKSKNPVVIIGPRSALFYPLENVGLIVIDEFHDGSYKQDQNPRYNAIRVAATLAKIHSAKLVLGSATPPVEDYYYAVQKQAVIYRLTEKPNNYSSQNKITYIDLSDKSNQSKHPLLSTGLIESMSNTLHQNKQVLLFLNKRGTSRLIICQDCGWSAKCSRCNIPYVYHHDTHTLKCHICDESKPAPNNCENCKSQNIIFKNPGTKAIEQQIRNIFPDKKIGRYDKDNKKSETFFSNHQEINSGEVDILIGTQQLTKGHDLANLHLVAMLLAESGLNFPDYKSEEKTFQLISQISGRVGRRGSPGEIIIQTYGKPNKLFEFAEDQIDGWAKFYDQEIQSRKSHNFPPFTHMLKVEIAAKNEKSAEEKSKKVFEILAKSSLEIEILGPSPAFVYQKADKYIWHIIIKSKKRSTLIDSTKLLPSYCHYDLDPSSLI